MIVIINSGPLMALAKLGQLELLKRLYDNVSVPNVVYDEVVTRGIELGFSDALQVKLAFQRGFLYIAEQNEINSKVQELPLEKGEKSVLSFALENKADLLLMDDILAREHAKKLGFSIKGVPV